jgi:hypothetical protein
VAGNFRIYNTQEARRQNIFLLPFIGRPPAGEPRGIYLAWAQRRGVVCRRRAKHVGNMHARANSRWQSAVNDYGRVGEGHWGEHQSEWRGLERRDSSSAMERTALALGSMWSPEATWSASRFSPIRVSGRQKGPNMKPRGGAQVCVIPEFCRPRCTCRRALR